MKKTLLFICLSIMTLTGCRTTAIQFKNDAKPQSYQQGKELMEFIGFKNSYTTDDEFLKKKQFFRAFGNKMARYNFAIDKADFFSGTFHFTELERYHSTKRYISYIEVIKHKDTYNDGYKDNNGLFFGGVFVAGLTVGTLFPVYVPMLVYAESNKCLLSLHGDYKLFIYDTQLKEIVYSKEFLIDDEVVCKGQYNHSKTNQQEINEYTETVFFNALANEYRLAYQFLENQQ